MNNIISRIAELKEELREMIDNAEVQKRSFLETEVDLFTEKENEILNLTKELEQRQAEVIIEQTNTKTQNKMNFKETLASAMRAVANNRSTEEFANVAGNTISCAILIVAKILFNVAVEKFKQHFICANNCQNVLNGGIVFVKHAEFALS